MTKRHLLLLAPILTALLAGIFLFTKDQEPPVAEAAATYYPKAPEDQPPASLQPAPSTAPHAAASTALTLDLAAGSRLSDGMVVTGQVHSTTGTLHYLVKAKQGGVLASGDLTVPGADKDRVPFALSLQFAKPVASGDGGVIVLTPGEAGSGDALIREVTF